MSWRDVAQAAVEAEQGGDNRDIRDKKPASAPIVSIVPNVPANPSRSLRQWKEGLLSIDPTQPCYGIAADRWRELVEDADWLVENYGQQAARDGWSTADLFGLLPRIDAAGGLADRLRSSRSLVMTADRACWRRFGVPMGFNRGSYPDLPLIWVARECGRT